MKKLFTLLIIFLITTVARAGDLEFGNVMFPDELHLGNQTPVVVNYQNIDPVETVYQIMFQMQLIRTSDEQLMDQRQIPMDSLVAGEVAEIDFGGLDFINLDPDTEYLLLFNTQQQNDQNLTNNAGQHLFMMLPPFDRDFVIDHVNQFLQENFTEDELQNAHAYMGQNIFPQGMPIQTFDRDEFQTTLEHDSWFIMIDWDIFSKYEKPVTYMLVSEGQDDVFHDVNWYPYLNDQLMIPDPFNPEGIIFGEPPLFLNQDLVIDYSQPNPTEKTDSVCAIIVTGKDTVLQSALDYDKKNLLQILQKNGHGQELSDDNVKCLNGGTKQEIKDAIEELKKNYKKIYFYYTGHGSKSGKMCTNDSSKHWMTYDELFKDLFGTDADEIVVIIDACYAGKALKAAEDSKDKKGKKVEVFASSDSNKTSRVVWWRSTADTNVKWCESFYTMALTECSNDTLANTNKDTIISFAEAHAWARSQNPTYGSDSLNKRQNPQSYTADLRITIEFLSDWITNYLNENYPSIDLSKVLTYLYPTELESGTDIVTFDTEEFSTTLVDDSWLLMVDWEPQSKYSKPVQYLIFDDKLEDPTIIDVNWFPIIAGDPWNPNPFAVNPPPLLFGEPPVFLPPPLPLDISGPVPNPTQDSVCAIIVTGKDSTMQGAFDYDRDWIKWFLQKNKAGEELGEDNVEVLDKATKAEIIAAIKKLKENYSKIYFYYAGHGSKTGKICTNDSSQHWLTYQELFKELYCTKAGEITVVLDACYSGLAIDAAKKDTTRGKRKVDVFTASDSLKTAKNVWYRSTTDTNNRWCQGYFTRNFVLCGKDTLANTNKDSVISFREAFDWVRKQNPNYSGADSINGTQNPQGFTADTRDTTKPIDIEAILKDLTQGIYDVDPLNRIVYFDPTPIPPDWFMHPVPQPELVLPIPEPMYGGWIDLDPLSRFGHPTILFTYNPETEEFKTLEANWYPVAKGPNGEINYLKDKILHGEKPKNPKEIPSTITEEAEGIEQDSVCAILVSGKDHKDSTHQKAFECDVKDFKDNITKEKRGPRLKESDVQTFNGIGKTALCKVLEDMVGKYNKVFFYYSGHASLFGDLALGDSKADWLTLDNLMKKLSDIGADEYCIVLDACYSGQAKAALRNDELFEDADVTLITSADSLKKSYTNYGTDGDGNRKGYGIFTHNFLKCLGEAGADVSMDSTTSFVEAFAWVNKQDPTDTRGRNMDSLQCPTITSTVQGDVDIEKKEISFKDNDVEIRNFNVDSFFDIQITLDGDERKFESPNARVHEISGSRFWNIKAGIQNGTFLADLIFQLRPQYEKLVPKLPNILGMVWREGNGDDWKPQYPSVHSINDNTILCGETDHFSDWAVAIISPEPQSSVDSRFLINNVEYGPNPFKNILNFEFNLDEPELFSIEVVDITGKQMDYIAPHNYGYGLHIVNLDGSKYTSGTYYCRLVSAKGIRTIKLVKE